MAQGKWDSLVKDVNEGVRGEGTSNVEHLKQHERHQGIIRERLLSCLAGASQPHIKSGSLAHQKLGSEVDSILDAIVENASKDGLDLDGELLDRLSMVSANLFAIQLKWQEIQQLLNQSK
jgi:hypothetical protein